ncbi:MAG: transcription antitermination factor NusB [Pseudomonadota bacterium]|nr:transcription antitermination factor NusB [Pseudomonadota bacterium]
MQAERSMRGRQRARELLVQALYQWQLTDQQSDELLEQFSARTEFLRIDQIYFRELFSAVLCDFKDLDTLISEHADRDHDQLDAVSRAVLLLSLSELKGRFEVPAKVVINEAVELAKRYGPTDSFQFINAVLDNVVKQIGRGSELGQA